MHVVIFYFDITFKAGLSYFLLYLAKLIYALLFIDLLTFTKSLFIVN